MGTNSWISVFRILLITELCTDLKCSSIQEKWNLPQTSLGFLVHYHSCKSKQSVFRTQLALVESEEMELLKCRRHDRHRFRQFVLRFFIKDAQLLFFCFAMTQFIILEISNQLRRVVSFSCRSRKTLKRCCNPRKRTCLSFQGLTYLVQNG